MSVQIVHIKVKRDLLSDKEHASTAFAPALKDIGATAPILENGINGMEVSSMFNTKGATEADSAKLTHRQNAMTFQGATTGPRNGLSMYPEPSSTNRSLQK